MPKPLGSFGLQGGAAPLSSLRKRRRPLSDRQALSSCRAESACASSLSVPGQLPVPARFSSGVGYLYRKRHIRCLSAWHFLLFADRSAASGAFGKPASQTWGEVLELCPPRRRGEEALFLYLAFWEASVLSTIGQHFGRSFPETLLCGWAAPLPAGPLHPHVLGAPLDAGGRSRAGKYYRALPPTRAPGPSLAQISYLAVPKGSSLAQAAEHMNLSGIFPRTTALIDQVPRPVGALLRASPLF